MLAAFGLVGSCATIAVVSVSLDKYEDDSRNELLTLSKVIALELSPEEQLRLSRSDKLTYGRLDSFLVRAQRQVGSVRRIFTVRRGSRGAYETALDTSVDTSKALPPSILVPTPGLDRRAKNVFDSGIGDVDEAIVTDRLGPYFTAYAPLVDSSGHVQAILGVDRDAAEITSHIESVRRATVIAIAMVLLLGGVFSLIIVRQLVRSAQSEAWLRGVTSSKRIFRATILELVLAGLALAVLSLGVESQVQIGELRLEESRSLDRSKALDQFHSRIERVLREPKADPGGLALLAQAAGEGGFDWLSKSLSSSAQQRSGWQEPLWRGLIALKRKTEVERITREGLHLDMLAMDERMTSALVLAILLSFGSMILLRSMAKQQQELLIAKHDSQRHQVAYEQVATNLPIGFYTYRDNEVQDANAMWDAMVTRIAGENRMMAVERTVISDDLGRLQGALKQAQDSRESFQLQFRLKTTSTEIRTFETRGSWISKPEEGLDHLLGFFVDVTDLVRVQEELEARNSEIQAKNLMLSHALSALEENLEAMVRGLAKAVEAKDPYTAGHSERVMRYSMLIGKALGFSADQMRTLERGTLIHDVGKIGIPDAVLNKSAHLDSGELEVIKSHPMIGAQMVSGIPVFEDCIPIIQWHHERLDGLGYPDGLSSEQIPDLVRIATVADVFDALTSTRAYRAALEIDEAISILRKDAKTGILDGRIVEVLADIVEREGVFWSPGKDKAA